jgi:hypothetical protein
VHKYNLIKSKGVLKMSSNQSKNAVRKNINFSHDIGQWLDEESKRQGFFSIGQFLTMVINTYREQRQSIQVMSDFTKLNKK